MTTSPVIPEGKLTARLPEPWWPGRWRRRDYIKETGVIGEYLYETYKGCSDNHYPYSRVIWDIAAASASGC